MTDNWNTERKLVFYVLTFISSKRIEDKNQALEWLSKVAEYYHTNLKQKPVKMNLYDALMMFLENTQSMDENINRIYSILKK